MGDVPRPLSLRHRPQRIGQKIEQTEALSGCRPTYYIVASRLDVHRRDGDGLLPLTSLHSPVGVPPNSPTAAGVLAITPLPLLP